MNERAPARGRIRGRDSIKARMGSRMAGAEDKAGHKEGKAPPDPFAPRGSPTLLDEALALLPAPTDRQRARGVLHYIAEYYNWLSSLEENSVRPSAALERFKKILATAVDLGELLNELNTDEIAEFYMASDILVRPGHPTWLEHFDNDLRFLAQTVLTAIRIVEYKKGGKGEPTLHRKKFALAKWALAADCALTLERNGGVPTGTTVVKPGKPPPPFASLVALIYEYASGLPPDRKGTGLETYVKKVGGLFASRRQLRQALSDEACSGPARENLKAELLEINLQIWPDQDSPEFFYSAFGGREK